MIKIKAVLVLSAIFLTQQAMADDTADLMGDANDKPCATIAVACSAAGFTREAAANKKFWQDCMKPILLGKTVSGVTVDPGVGQACKTLKIEKMKKELQEFQASMPNNS